MSGTPSQVEYLDDLDRRIAQRKGSTEGPLVRVGICAMDKKAQSKPMKKIVTRMNARGEFDIFCFGDEVILNKGIDEWPHCDVLLAWHSSGFPLAKAQKYVAKYRPFVVNDVFKQTDLLDRRKVYETLVQAGVPTPRHIVVSRTPEQAAEEVHPEGFEETPDFVCVGDTKIKKPFVEKPTDGDDHNVWVYYSSEHGGGVQTLFRKQENRASEYMQNHPGTVRRNGSYIYEEFIATRGTDVKVYTVGNGYAHAEARKSPVIDGKVQRSADGKEVRYPVLLSPHEKEIAARIADAFKQRVCGFDLLREDEGHVYVCDVNGWSFVKNSSRYYNDAAEILREIMLEAVRPNRLKVNPSLPDLGPLSDPSEVTLAEVGKEPSGHRQSINELNPLQEEIYHTNSMAVHEELRGVLVIVRHGDRTPKQKLKFRSTHPLFLDLYAKHKDSKGEQAKLKDPKQLQAFLTVCQEVEASLDQDDGLDDGEDDDKGADTKSNVSAAASPPGSEVTKGLRAQLRVAQQVFEGSQHFSGINRKIQMKPTMLAADGTEPAELQLIVKWGGVLTHTGRKQAEDLGRIYRRVMYPSQGLGLLRLHSTFRHDFKIASSDEGRVQTSAAAFVKGLLDLEGTSLTPILVSLVRKDAVMLDAFHAGAVEDIALSKDYLYKAVTFDPATGQSYCRPPQYVPVSPPVSPSPSQGHGICGSNATLEATAPKIPRLPEESLQMLHRLRAAIRQLTGQLRDRVLLCASYNTDGGQPAKLDHVYSALNHDPSEYRQDPRQPYGRETVLMMFDRWRKMEKNLYLAKDSIYDISKIPDVYDSIKYDCIHNRHLGFDYTEVYVLAKSLASCVIPAEYGINPESKLRIGGKIAKGLITKLLLDLKHVKRESLHVVEAQPVSVQGEDEECAAEEAAEHQRMHRLAPHAVDVNSPNRHVRSRVYFTSESHIHALVNILRHHEVNSASILSQAGQKLIDDVAEYDYLSQIVIRLFENSEKPPRDPARFRVEIQFSNGMCFNALEEPEQDTRPRTQIQRGNGVTLDEFQAFMAKWADLGASRPEGTTKPNPAG